MASNSNGRSSSRVALRECLADLSLPEGLLSSVSQRYQSCDSWLWIVDNSSFMKERDAHIGRVGSNGVIERFDGISRWKELQVALAAHSKMSSKVWMPTKYRLVNEPTGKAAGQSNKFTLCWSNPMEVKGEMNHIKQIMSNDSLGHAECKLTSRVASLRKVIAKAEHRLLEENKRLTVMICTQGMPTNGKGQSSKSIQEEFELEMYQLSKLPVKIVVRLTTDDEGVKDMYNDMRLDGICVLDDWWGEAMEVYLHNPWLTYSLGLHKLREAGLAPDIFTVLDERPLTLDEIHQLSELLFLGEDGSGVIPHPPYQPTRAAQLRRTSWLTNWTPFITGMKYLIGRQKLQWNPLKKKMTPWIDLKKLESSLRGQLDDKGSPFGFAQNESARKGIRKSQSMGEDMNKYHTDPPVGFAQKESARRGFQKLHSMPEEKSTYHTDPPAGNNHRRTNARRSPNEQKQSNLRQTFTNGGPKPDTDYEQNETARQGFHKSRSMGEDMNKYHTDPPVGFAQKESARRGFKKSHPMGEEKSTYHADPPAGNNHRRTNSRRSPNEQKQNNLRHTFTNGGSKPDIDYEQPDRGQSSRNFGDHQRPCHLTLIEVLQQWSHQPPGYKTLYPLGRLLVTVPNTFPPKNTKVEPHEYFAKWKTFDKEAFIDVSGDEQKAILKRAARKAKFFLHPDKLPKDLSDDQTLLFKTVWDVITEQESKTLG